MPRRTKGVGSLIKLKNSPSGQARVYNQSGPDFIARNHK